MKRMLLILVCLLLLTACQPTPETEVIPNKADDALRSVIAENGKGFDPAEYKAGLPPRWEELLDAGTGAVTVTVNGPVTFPAADRIPIREIVPAGVDLDAVEKLVQLLVPAWAVIGVVTDSGFSTDIDTGDICAFNNKTMEGPLLILNAADGTLIGRAAVE